MRSNDTYLNLLCTYASCGTGKTLIEKLVNMSREGKANVMIDSGAFTAFNARGNYAHINVQDYCNFLHEYGNDVEKYVMLDVIGNAEASRKNYELMVADGLKPMFVATMFDNDYDYINSTLQLNENICVAGGATTKGEWMTQRFQTVYAKTNGKAKIHGLAYVTFPKMLQLNLTSVDSSSWKASSLRFGAMQYFCNGIKAVYKKDVLRDGKLTNKYLLHLMDRCKVTPSMFKDRSNTTGNNSIMCMINIISHIEMQKYCYRRGLRYFLAVNNAPDLRKIEYIAENYNDINYKDFKQI